MPARLKGFINHYDKAPDAGAGANPAPVTPPAVTAPPAVETASPVPVTDTAPVTPPAQGIKPGDKGYKSAMGGDTEPEKPDADKIFNADDKKKEEDRKAETAPEYKLNFGDAEPDKGFVSDFSKTAQELKLTNEQAQKLVDIYMTNSKKAYEAQQAEETARLKEWKAEREKSPTYREDVAYSNRVLKEFGDAEVTALFHDTWVGDYPAAVRFLAKVGRALSQDPGHLGSRSAGINNGKDVASLLFNNS